MGTPHTSGRRRRRLDGKAIDALQKIGPAAIPAGLNALAHDRWQFRAGESHALGLYGAEAKAAVPALAAAVTDPRTSIVRRLAADALALTGTAAKTAIPVLSRGLTNTEDVRIRISVAYALARTDPESEPAYQLLVEALQYVDQAFWDGVGGWQEKYTRSMEVQKNGQRFFDQEHDVRALAARTLGALGPPASRTLPALIASLRNGNAEAAAFALGRLGPAGAPAVPVLIEQLVVLQAQRWNEYAFRRFAGRSDRSATTRNTCRRCCQILKIPGDQRYSPIADALPERLVMQSRRWCHCSSRTIHWWRAALPKRWAKWDCEPRRPCRP